LNCKSITDTREISLLFFFFQKRREEKRREKREERREKREERREKRREREERRTCLLVVGCWLLVVSSASFIHSDKCKYKYIQHFYTWITAKAQAKPTTPTVDKKESG